MQAMSQQGLTAPLSSGQPSQPVAQGHFVQGQTGDFGKGEFQRKGKGVCRDFAALLLVTVFPLSCIHFNLNQAVDRSDDDGTPCLR